MKLKAKEERRFIYEDKNTLHHRLTNGVIFKHRGAIAYKTVCDSPNNMIYHQIINVSEKEFYLFGQTESSLKYEDHLYHFEYDIGNRIRITELSTWNYNRIGYTCLYYEQKQMFFILGGLSFDGSLWGDWYSYSLKDKKWKYFADFSRPKALVGAWNVKVKVSKLDPSAYIFVFGGISGKLHNKDILCCLDSS